MKTLRTLFVIAITVVGFNSRSIAQVDATASTSGTVVQAIDISKDRDLSFGTFAVNSTGGTVVVAATDAGTRSQTQGVSLQAGGTVSSAKFTVSGYDNSTYTVSMPASLTISNGTPAEDMTVDLVKSVGATATLDGSGESVIYVGGTLTAAANQPAGEYSNANDLKITVDYQ